MDILPRWVYMIKTELIGREYGGEMGGLVFVERIWYGLNDDI
jgi:hypothetical protein